VFSSELAAAAGDCITIQSFGGTATVGDKFTIDNISVREVIPTWYDTDIDGTPIQPSVSIPTRSGTKQWYQEPFANPFGYSNWPARTNKCTCRKFNPVDTTNITKSGDAAAVLSVVDDTAALTAAGLIGICTSGKVYKLDNSAGSTVAFAAIGGAAGNLNTHSCTAYVRGTGRVYIGGNIVTAPEIGGATNYFRIKQENKPPSVTNDPMYVYLRNGEVAYFILPQLEEGAFATPPIFDPLNDSLTSITRAATNLTLPTAGVLPVNDFGIWGEVIPGASGQFPAYIFDSYTSASEDLRILANTLSSLSFQKVIGGVASFISTTLTTTINTPFQYMVFQSRVYGMGIRVKQQGGAWPAWALKNDADGRLDAPVAATYQAGARNNANHFAGYYPSLVIIQHVDPKAKLEELDTKYGA
jgi:hypothetical protein